MLICNIAHVNVLRLISTHFNTCRNDCQIVRRNLAMHRSVTPFVIRQPIRRPRLLERVYKPMRTPHWHGDLQSLLQGELNLGYK